jgi:hypothetical protein
MRNGSVFFKFLLVSAGIFWLAMMGLLFVRNSEFDVRSDDVISSKESKVHSLKSGEVGEGVEGVEWMGIYLNRNKIGYSMSITDTTEDGSIHLIERASMRISLMGTTQEVKTFLTAIADTDFATKEFSFEISSREHSLKADGRVEGKKLLVTVHTGGMSSEESFTLEETYLPLSIEAMVAKRGLKEGDRFSFPLFDPTTLKPGKMSVLVGGMEEIDLSMDPGFVNVTSGRKLTFTFMGIETRVWVNKTGNVLKEEGPMGMVMVRESEAEAHKFTSGEPVEILTLFSIPSNVTIENPRETEFLKVKLKSEGLEGLNVEDDRQKVKDLSDGILLEITQSEIQNPAEQSLGMTQIILRRKWSG